MVEQICFIEHYKNEVLETEGRALTSEQAAAEWIEKYGAAGSHPEIDHSGLEANGRSTAPC
jgi:hypothetical protein